MNEGLKVWNDMRVSNLWQNLNFWMNYPFNILTEVAIKK